MTGFTGYSVVGIIVAVVAGIAAPSLNYTNLQTFVSLEAAICAFSLMAMSIFLTTRVAFLESMFDGLDRLYVAHRRIGYAALVLILIHYFNTPNFKGLFINSYMNEFARQLGNCAFYFLSILVLLSVFKVVPFFKIRVPYHVWSFSHRFIGATFVALALHQFYIKKPFDQAAPIAIILNSFGLLGVLSYLWTQLFSHFTRRDYVVDKVQRHPAATIMRVKPIGRRIKVLSGQFAVLHARRRGLREPHPFTVAEIGEDGALTFAMKPLGDFTRRMSSDIRAGDLVRLGGGYGRFRFTKGSKRQIWIAGGIGITPFLCMLPEVAENPGIEIDMVYCVREQRDALALDDFLSAARKLPNFSFLLHVSSEAGRLDPDSLLRLFEIDDRKCDLFFCGPTALRRSILSASSSSGNRFRRVHFEHFEFR